MTIKISKIANEAARVIVRHVEKATGNELQFADCQAIMIHVQLALNSLRKPAPLPKEVTLCDGDNHITLLREKLEVGWGGSVVSSLPREPGEDLYNSALDGMESLLLAQHVAGMDLSTKVAQEAFVTANQSLADNL